MDFTLFENTTSVSAIYKNSLPTFTKIEVVTSYSSLFSAFSLLIRKVQITRISAISKIQYHTVSPLIGPEEKVRKK